MPGRVRKSQIRKMDVPNDQLSPSNIITVAQSPGGTATTAEEYEHR
jgi:hypothetical protein